MTAPLPELPPADDARPDLFLGTIGWGYEQWKGVFYPEAMPGRQYLAHYAQFFNSVEIDSTFYGTPPVERVLGWAQSVPEGFRFCPKTPQQITHEHRLNRPDLMVEFVDTVRRFGQKLGVILLQLPPDFSVVEKETLAAFLAALPKETRYAVEFRHTSWATRETAELLRRYRVCWVAADYVIMPRQVTPTAGFLYLRFLGRHGRYKTKDRELRDPTPELQWWIEAQLRPYWHTWRQVFGFFNNDYAGYSPESCRKFKTLLGLDADLPHLAQQGTLF